MTLGPPRRPALVIPPWRFAQAFCPGVLLRRSPQCPVSATCSNDPPRSTLAFHPSVPSQRSTSTIPSQRSAPTIPQRPTLAFHSSVLPRQPRSQHPPQRLTPTSPAPRHPALAIPLHVLLLTDAFILFTQLLSPSPPCSAVVPFRRITLSVLGAQPAALHAFSFASAFRMHFRSPESSACISVR